MLFRTVKRRSVWKKDPAEIVGVEFQDPASGLVDLSPSFYTVGDGDDDVTKIAAEHMAVAGMSPDSKGPPYVDLVDSDGATAHQTPTEPDLFEFASSVHQEVRFSSEAELVAFVSARVERLKQGGVGKWRVVDYVVRRRDAHDQEWLAVLALDTHAAWRDKCDQRAPPNVP